MSKQLRDTIYQELSAVTIIDPHTHINALNPGSETLADILGYHYYTELAHSAGMPKADIEEPGLDPKEKVGRLMDNLGPISNTIQYSWFVEMAQELLGFEGDMITAENWEPLYDRAAERMAGGDWAEEVLRASKLDGVFLTNDFDDPLEGFDTKVYIPCLRTDDLVFHLAKPEVRERFEKATGRAPTTVADLSAGIGALFNHFAGKGAKACAISLPPDFAPTPVSNARAATALDAIHAHGVDAPISQRRALANYVFWNLAQRCADYQLPFDLMIGVNRGVYEDGVFQGQDLYDSRVSLVQYKQLFNAFQQVTFPVSVLASVTNQELTSYAWIFPNVVTNGHWWYSNTPTYIEHDASARLEAVPRTKQIGYYSDMYKLEFALPKFNMYKRILAKILAERYVIDRGWTEERAIEFGLQVLRDNSEQIFKVGRHYEPPYLPPPELETVAEGSGASDDGSDVTGASDDDGLGIAALGGIGVGLATAGAAVADAMDDSAPAEFAVQASASEPVGGDFDALTIDLDEESDPVAEAPAGLEPPAEAQAGEWGGGATVDLDNDATMDDELVVDFDLEDATDPDHDTVDGDGDLGQSDVGQSDVGQSDVGQNDVGQSDDSDSDGSDGSAGSDSDGSAGSAGAPVESAEDQEDFASPRFTDLSSNGASGEATIDLSAEADDLSDIEVEELDLDLDLGDNNDSPPTDLDDFKLDL